MMGPRELWLMTRRDFLKTVGVVSTFRIRRKRRRPRPHFIFFP